MTYQSKIYCFRANYPASKHFDSRTLPDWLSLEANWQGYRIVTVPWLADVARILELLPIEDSPEAWIDYLESLGLNGVEQVCCEEFFEDKMYCL